MSRKCTICDLEPKIQLEVDRQLASHRSIAGISRRFGVSEAALTNHRDNHLSRQLLRAHDIKQTLDATALIDSLNDLVARTEKILKASEQEGKRAISLAAIRELRAGYEFMVKLAVTLHQMKQAQAEQEASADSLTLRDALNKFSTEDLRLFRCMIAKANGEDVTEELTEILQQMGIPYKRAEPRPVIDVTRMSDEPEPEMPTLDLEPATPAPEPEYKPTRRPRLQPSPAEIERSRRQITERILDSY